MLVSAGAVVFRGRAGNPKYLLLHNVKGHWDFPKGRMRKRETREAACRREILEETGIRNARFMPGFHRRLSWTYREDGRKLRKTAHYFLAEASSMKVRISREHSDFAWLGLKAALGRVGYANARMLLRAASRFLERSQPVARPPLPRG